jgi:proteasome assembly chaperone (PAC2) family protein
MFREFLLEEPIEKVRALLVMLPNVSQITSRISERMIEVGKFTQYSKVVMHFLPDILLSDELGEGYLPGLEFYRPSKNSELQLGIVTSKLQINQLPVPYSYWTAEYIVRKARALSSNFIITVSDFDYVRPDVRFFASSKELAEKISENCNIRPVKKSYFYGISSLIVPISKLYKINAVSLVSLVTKETQPQVLTYAFNSLLRLLEFTERA